MKKYIIAVMTLIFSQISFAGSPSPVVYELFTSEGCSSCPPAEQALQEIISEDKDVVALEYHVDYWNSPWWTDIFSNSNNTMRQYGYKLPLNVRASYTPQAIIAGNADISGSQKGIIKEYIRGKKERIHLGYYVPIEIQPAADGINVNIKANPKLALNHIVTLASLKNNASIQVRGGENRGKTVTHNNIVVDYKYIADWDGQQNFSFNIKNADLNSIKQKTNVKGNPIQADKFVILVQEKLPNGLGPINGAALANYFK